MQILGLNPRAVASEFLEMEPWHHFVFKLPAAAAAAKLLQSCPSLCDPIDGSPPVSPVPGILQARTLTEGKSASCLDDPLSR